MAVGSGAGASIFAGEMEELPRATLQLLSGGDVPRALVEKLVRCAADELVRDRVVQRSAEGQAAHVAQLVSDWQGGFVLWYPAARMRAWGVIYASLLTLGL